MTNSGPADRSTLEAERIGEDRVDVAWAACLQKAPAIRQALLQYLGAESFGETYGGVFEGVEVSVTIGARETDVVAAWRSSADAPLVVMIEDKLATGFQKDQGRDYARRARQLRARGCEVRTLLVAPARYLATSRSDLKYFDYKLPLETAVEWMITSADCSGLPEVAFVVEALRRLRDGQALGAKGMFTDQYRILEHACANRSSAIRIRNKPTDWVFFTYPGADVGVELHYRVKDGITELTMAKAFKGNVDQVLRQVPGHWRSVRSGTSTHIRNPAPAISPTARTGGLSHEDARRVVNSIDELVRWWSKLR